MLDIKYIRENPDKVKQNALNKGVEVDIDKLLELDAERRGFTQGFEELQHKYKTVTKELGWVWKTNNAHKRHEGIGFTENEIAEKLQASHRAVSPLLDDTAFDKDWARLVKPHCDKADGLQALIEAAIVFGRAVERLQVRPKGLDRQRYGIEEKINEVMLDIPNIADDDVPVGGEDANKVLREWGEEVCKVGAKAHWDIGDELGILDTKLAAKLAGSNFALFKGAGAKLVRSLMAFMLDTHSAKGYVEVWPPVLANREIMTGTGQLPKFEQDMYRFEKDDLYLIPTAEVPLTALHAGEILPFTDLPLGYCAYTPCFRREAGAYGRETRGLLRVHQFDKVEILKVTTAQQAPDALEELLSDAEEIIRKLGLRYRVALLSTREMTFASARTYDIEIWSPGVKRWLEVSSVSSFGAFQARRLNLRYRDKKRKVHFCHTMNGSGVAFARLIACLLETYQQDNGTVDVPEALQPYFGGKKIEK